MIILSVVPGKNSWLRDNWIRAPDCDWNSVIVEPPFPMTEPAAEFDTRNLIYVGFSSESEKRKHEINNRINLKLLHAHKSKYNWCS